MAGEYKRTRGRKLVQLPGGDEMFIPVLTGISLIDARDRYQEHQYSIDNTAAADRDVHVDDVIPTIVDEDGVPTSTPAVQSGSPLKVERIDTWKILDPRSRYQESRVAFDNKTGASDAPPHFSTHLKTHIYRYYKDPTAPSDDGTWIDSELIDELAAVDPRDRYQETVHTFNNPTNAEFRNGDLSGQASDADPDITIAGAEGIEGNPVRTDPFQNVINFHVETGEQINFIFVNFVGHYSTPYSGISGGGQYCYPASLPATGVVATEYLQSMEWQGWTCLATTGRRDTSGAEEVAPGTVSGEPSISPTSFSTGSWEWLGGNKGGPVFLSGPGGPPAPGKTYRANTAGLEGTSWAADLWDLKIDSSGVGCYGVVAEPPQQGFYAGGTIGEYGIIGNSSVDGAGITYTEDGIAWNPIWITLSPLSTGWNVEICFERPPVTA